MESSQIVQLVLWIEIINGFPYGLDGFNGLLQQLEEVFLLIFAQVVIFFAEVVICAVILEFCNVVIN